MAGSLHLQNPLANRERFYAPEVSPGHFHQKQTIGAPHDAIQ
jgi:hypothetical protein